LGNVIAISNSGEAADAVRAVAVVAAGQSEAVQELPAPMPEEFKEAIATIDTELNNNLQVLGTHIAQAERVQRDTLKALDALFERVNRQLTGKVEGAQNTQQDLARKIEGMQQQCEVIQSGYRAAQEQFEGYQKRYDEVKQSYADARQEFEGFQHRYDGVQQQFKGVQHQFEGLKQEFQAVQQASQAVTQQAEAVQKTVQNNDQRYTSIDQKLAVLDQFDTRLTTTATDLAALRTTAEEEGRRRGNIEISIGEMSRQLSQLGAIEIDKIKDEIDKLRAVAISGRRRQRFALAVAMLALIVG